MNKRQIVLSVGAIATVLAASPAFAQAVSSDWRILTFGVFGAIIAVTMYVTYLAAKRTKTAADTRDREPHLCPRAPHRVSGDESWWIAADLEVGAYRFET